MEHHAQVVDRVVSPFDDLVKLSVRIEAGVFEAVPEFEQEDEHRPHPVGKLLCLNSRQPLVFESIHM